MTFEGVTFVEEACVPMGKEKFIEHHKDAFWEDRDEATRKKMLADAYDMMSPPKPDKKKPASKVDKK